MSSGATSLSCSSTYGSAINPSDCNIALGILRSNLQSQPQIHLPTGSYCHTCAIGVSQSADASNILRTSPVSSGLSTPLTNLVPSLSFLIDTCVGGTISRVPSTSRLNLGRRRGGVLRRDGLTFVVANPMQVPVWGTCLAPPEPSGMDLAQCIEWRMEFGGAWNNAGDTQDAIDTVEPAGGQADEEGGGAEESLLGAMRTTGQESASQQEAGPHQLAAGYNTLAPVGGEIESPLSPGNASMADVNSGRDSQNSTLR